MAVHYNNGDIGISTVPMGTGDKWAKTTAAVVKKYDLLLEGNIKLLNTIDFQSEILCCRFDNTGKLLAVGLTNGNIIIYCVETKGAVYIIQCDINSRSPVTSLRWKPENSAQAYGYVLMATYVSGDVKTWHVTTGKCLNTHAEDSQLLCSDYNGFGTQSVVGTADGKVHVYDDIIGVKVTTMGPSVNGEIMDAHVMRVFALQFNPFDDYVFMSGGWDNTIHWWDTRVSDRCSIKQIAGPHICGESLDIEPSSQSIVIGSWRKDKNLEIYDFGSGKLIKEIPSYSKSTMLYCAQWKDRGSIIVGGSHNHVASIADYTSALTIGSALNLPAAVCALDNTRIGVHPKIAVASDKTIFMFSDDV